MLSQCPGRAKGLAHCNDGQETQPGRGGFAAKAGIYGESFPFGILNLRHFLLGS